MQIVAKLTLLSILSTVPVFSQTRPRQPETPTFKSLRSGLKLVDGTPVRLRTGRELSSATEKTGETVNFEVVDDVRLNDVIVIAHDSIAVGSVINAKPRGRVGKGGKLDISIDSVIAVSGDKVPLRTVRQTKGESQVGTMTTGLILTGIFFFPAAPLFLFVKGKDVSVAKGTEFIAYVNGDTTIDQANIPSRFFPLASTMPPPRSCTYVLRSDPDAAELSIDGNLIGNTPSTLELGFGNHTISMFKLGFKRWDQTVTSMECESVTLNARLEKINEP